MVFCLDGGCKDTTRRGKRAEARKLKMEEKVCWPRHIELRRNTNHDSIKIHKKQLLGSSVYVNYYGQHGRQVKKTKHNKRVASVDRIRDCNRNDNGVVFGYIKLNFFRSRRQYIMTNNECHNDTTTYDEVPDVAVSQTQENVGPRRSDLRGCALAPTRLKYLIEDPYRRVLRPLCCLGNRDAFLDSINMIRMLPTGVGIPIIGAAVATPSMKVSSMDADLTFGRVGLSTIRVDMDDNIIWRGGDREDVEAAYHKLQSEHADLQRLFNAKDDDDGQHSVDTDAMCQLHDIEVRELRHLLAMASSNELLMTERCESAKLAHAQSLDIVNLRLQMSQRDVRNRHPAQD